MEPHEATDDWLKSEFHQKYNLTLCFRCYMISDKYDEKEDYVLPACIILSSLEFAKNLIRHQAVVYQLKEKRVHGLADDMMKSTDDNLYVKTEE